MPDVRDARKKVKIAIAALLAVDIISGLALLSPLVGSERSRREQLDQLWRELQQKTRAAEPLRDFDKKIATALFYVSLHGFDYAFIIHQNSLQTFLPTLLGQL